MTNYYGMIDLNIKKGDVDLASFLHYKKIILSTVAGYIIGFICSMIYNKDGIDPGGGRTNNAWKGIIWELIDKTVK